MQHMRMHSTRQQHRLRALVKGAGIGAGLHQQPGDGLVAHQAGPVQRSVARLVGQAHGLQAGRWAGGVHACRQAGIIARH